MPTFAQHTLLVTQGEEPKVDAIDPQLLRVRRLTELPALDGEAELFGPWADRAREALGGFQSAFLLSSTRASTGGAERFFAEARAALVAATRGLSGWAVDVLKLWPLPLSEVDQLPVDPRPEDILSVGFYSRGSERFRAETFGLSKLDQSEITFEFTGQDLLDEAALVCAHLADYAMGQSRRAQPGHEMMFGFDQIRFVLPADGPEGSLRRWHPPFIQRALPPEVFAGVGLLEMHAFPLRAPQPAPDLTELLRRSFEQRLELERCGVSGESPHRSSVARACACAGGANGLRGYRVDPETVRESGWVFSCTRTPHPPEDLPQVPLTEVVSRLPQVVRYLALPPGTQIEWNGSDATINTDQVAPTDDDDHGSLL